MQKIFNKGFWSGLALGAFFFILLLLEGLEILSVPVLRDLAYLMSGMPLLMDALFSPDYSFPIYILFFLFPSLFGATLYHFVHSVKSGKTRVLLYGLGILFYAILGVLSATWATVIIFENYYNPLT